MNGVIRNTLLQSITTALIACILILFPQPSAKAAEDVAGIEVEIAFRSLYAREKAHKALVVDPSGAWNLATNQVSAARAKQEALRRCSYWLQKAPWGRGAKCEFFAVDDKIVWPRPLPGPPLGQPLPLPDDILSRAVVLTPEKGQVRGVVLALHGCGRLEQRPTLPYQNSWFDFLRARGLQVYFPNSYLDPKVKPLCGAPSPEKRVLVGEMDRIRIAQAKRSIAELRKMHPGLPIYIWGHSAGGNIAQSLDDDIAGMFIVSNWCGIGWPELELVRRTVPVLFIFGEDDDLLMENQKISAKLINKKCGAYYRTKKRKLVIAEGSNHWATIWRQNTLDAVASVLGQRTFQLKASPARGALDGEARRAFETTFPSQVGKKAFAVGPQGVFAMSAGWDNEEDAIQSALHDCARKAGALPYAEGGEQRCRVYATGNKGDDRLEPEATPAGSP